jgi:hypothetical protein
MPVQQVLHSVDETRRKIASGRRLLLAGDEELLRSLPRGEWIAGTIPYFMTEAGGLSTNEKIFVTELPDYVPDVSLRVYDERTIAHVYTDIPRDGFAVAIMPAASSVHTSFALGAPTYESFALRPLIGWVAGTHLSQIGTVTPKVLSGDGTHPLEDQVVVMHVRLPRHKAAEIGIVNIFKQGDGDTITFEQNGFKVTDAFVNGRKTNFASYVTEKGLDIRLPLVADYCGTPINISLQTVDPAKGEVRLYAPIFAGIEYRHAQPISDYVTEFVSSMPRESGSGLIFSCNCILNYLHSKLEGKQTGNVTGPITFGEIAYQLMNQTMVYLTVTDLPVTA